ncbi:MAG: hypothetical protein A3F35_03550 [Candidatus Woykebacteria bacterium RIFCSPHIGHO2_12_FULL_45_10]|uniref:Methylated-DNA-[protein]-cysteine S-methyltransferase DNA binding domain-containing protein n=1 Tax=Candidatus Woykebacteria bacterium RIFCSPHIGHO2_12_FULL_45_10 TaxID=1802603 RepID=A0A1G1WS34_9BACT|nr:MAG: hypothetical protein A3F35_03550 [Candidatus Woykebacteria bacterium RIFCSPHIGHO2_12_FULL_45_10]
MLNKRDLVYKIVASIPKGKVVTYGQIARLTGLNARVVGNYLHNSPDPKKIPCHRVVNYQGKLAANYAFGGARSQRLKLEEEGLNIIKEGKVDLEEYLWKNAGKFTQRLVKT